MASSVRRLALCAAAASLTASAALPHGLADVLENALTPEIITLTDPEVVALALRTDGYRAKVVEGDSGPIIESAAFGIDFSIVFYGCEGRAKFCTGMLFLSGFDLEFGAAPDLMEEWNVERLVGRAFLDKTCDPFIDFYVVADPAMSLDGWGRVMSDWLLALNDFSEWVDPDNWGEVRRVNTCKGDQTL